MRRLMALVAVLCAGVLALGGCTPVATSATVQGVSYEVTVDSELGSTPRPLLLFLGGYGQTIADIENTTKLRADTLNKGWSIAYLQNDTKSWNSGSCCSSIPDNARILATLNDIKARVPVDPKKVYIGGFSNGSAEAIEMLMTYPATFAAGEGVAFPQTRINQTSPASVRWRHWHASNDSLVQPSGGCVHAYAAGLPCAGIGSALSTYTEKDRLPTGSVYQLTWYTGNHTWNGVNNADYLNWLGQWSR